jgi:1,2-phenylacetyl-CoA epoxidase catalytic subunit
MRDLDSVNGVLEVEINEARAIEQRTEWLGHGPKLKKCLNW